LTLTPAMYLVSLAWQWSWGIRLVEVAFLPSLFLSIAAGLLAFKRAQARRLSKEDASPTNEHREEPSSF
jgi:hypothetical protein